jgi:hypothetical protein
MPTILELFKNKELLFPGGSTAKGAVKKDSETFIEQETSGIRIKSLVDINNPLIYGNEATRLIAKSTPALETMKQGTGGEQGGGGLVGKGLSKLGVDGGVAGLRDKINDKLGIPKLLIPTEVVNEIIDGESNKKGEGSKNDSQTPITQDLYGKNGSEVGKFLKQTGGGNPTTIGKQALGKGIGLAKDKLRGALFGDPDTIGTAKGTTYAIEETTDQSTYSDNNKSKTLPSADDSSPLADLQKNTKLGINLNTVSPIYGIHRKENERPNNKQFIENSRYTPLNPKTMKEGKSDVQMNSVYKLSNTDSINNVSPTDEYTMEENAFMKVGEQVYKDFIPLWFKKIGADKPLVFRATITGLTETSTPSWSSNKFIGNPYSFHMYDGVERSLAFNIKLAAASPVELNVIWERLKILTSYTYPTIGAGLVTPPIITFRLGDMYVDREVLLDSLTYTIPDESTWETKGEIGYLPKVIDVALSMKFIESAGAEDRLYDMAISKAALTDINDKRTAEKNAIDLEAKNRGVKPAEAPVVKETSKKQSTVTVLTGAGTDLAAQVSSTVKSASDKGKDLKSTPADLAKGIPDPVAGQSATADNLDGKTPIVAAKEAQNTENLTEWQSDRLIRLKATGNYTNVKIISVSKLPTWVKEHSHNPENFKNPRYKGVKCVYVQAEGSFEEHDYAPNTFYMAMGMFTSGKSQFFRTFANDLDDNPKYYFQPGEIEAMKTNAESRAMDRAQGLGGMF